MGEHRVTIRIIWGMHGHKADSGEMWLNGSSDEALPRRAQEWIEEQHAISMHNYEEEQHRAYTERMKGAVEKEERAELARLKAKYESGAGAAEPPLKDQN